MGYNKKSPCTAAREGWCPATNTQHSQNNKEIQFIFFFFKKALIRSLQPRALQKPHHLPLGLSSPHSPPWHAVRVPHRQKPPQEGAHLTGTLVKVRHPWGHGQDCSRPHQARFDCQASSAAHSSLAVSPALGAPTEFQVCECFSSPPFALFSFLFGLSLCEPRARR